MPEPALEIARHRGSLDELAASWTRLTDEQHPGAAFRTLPWIASWWKWISTSREPHVLVAREQSRIVGILPLYAERTALGGRRLRLMGDGIVGSDYQGAIARAADQARVAGAFAAALDGADELWLDDLAEDDPLAIAVAARQGRSAVRHICPHVRVSGDFESYLSSLPGGAGAQWKRRRRWLEKFSDFRVERLSTPDEIERGLGVLFDLHRQRWALEGGSDAIDGPRTERFHREAGRRLAELGWARIFVLHADGAPRAALYGFRHGDRFAYYQAGHAPAWRQRSVGTVLLGDVIHACFEERLVEFDFLHGGESYKLQWANGARSTVGVRARGRGLRPWLTAEARRAWAHLRAAARHALPAPAVEWVRARERRRRGGAS